MSATGWAVLFVAILLVLVAVTGALWARSRRRDVGDPLLERAETASKLAHELKNPLMAIRGLASTGDRLFDRLSEVEQREFFRLIDEEAARMQRVVEQSATAMRIDADALQYDLREEDLGDLVREVASTAERGEHPIEVRTQPGLTVQADRRHLSEAIANLIDNAAKFSPPDAPIGVSARTDGDEAVVEIADRGPGIPDERLEQVFQRFTGWRPAGYEETPGAGLGLSLARAHVSAHGGRIEVLARDDGGTILRIALPVETAEETRG